MVLQFARLLARLPNDLRVQKQPRHQIQFVFPDRDSSLNSLFPLDPTALSYGWLCWGCGRSISRNTSA